MQPKPWQQVTALVTLGVGGAVTGFSFVPKAPAELTSPSGLPVHLMALAKAAQPADDGHLRSAIVNVARHFLNLATRKPPAEMEAIIWHHDSIDGVDHGESCAAFASLTLELGSQAAGQQSWVTGGTSYPWPLHKWADVRVDPNPGSIGITSVLQDAQAHGRWHALGDGYVPQPGDWVLFDQHVEVVTSFSGGVLDTIGGDSLPNYSVNAHTYPAPLSGQGVAGFVNNGNLTPAPTVRTEHRVHAPRKHHERPHAQVPIPGLQPRHEAPAPHQPVLHDAPAIPGLPTLPAPRHHHYSHKHPYTRHHPARVPPVVNVSSLQQAFINAVAPAAIASQHRYGIPASVTIAQAIDESGWGQSELATRDHNLFGIKGTGPAGSDNLPTQEYLNGAWVTVSSPFRVYDNIGQSVDDHGSLLANSGYYGAAMAVRNDPNAFANALTGVYATDPQYGAKLIGFMQRYGLYRYDGMTPAAHPKPHPHRPAHVKPHSNLPAIPGLPAAPSSVMLVRYSTPLPLAVRHEFAQNAKRALVNAEPLYRDVASLTGIPWRVLAACDWMQCQASPRLSPVYGEKLGATNADGTVYQTRSQALARCAADLAELARAVYHIDLTEPRAFSVRELASVFAAFRWGALLQQHHTSPMEFPYSVAGLTDHHMKMRWPRILAPSAPDKPGSRFRQPFGAVPAVLSLNYPATV